MPAMTTHDHVRPLRALLGAMMAVVGATAVVLTVLAANGSAPGLDRLAFSLGLAGGPLLSGMAQVAGMVGVWLAWTALPRRER